MSTNKPFNGGSGFDIQTNSGITGDVASSDNTDFLDGHTQIEGAFIDPIYEQISKDMDGAEGSDNFEQANSVSDFPQILASEYQTEIPGVDTVLEWFIGASNKVGEFIDTHSPHVQEAAKNVVGTITSALSSLADRFSARWNSPGNEIRSWVTQTVESATQSIRDGIEDFAETYGDDIQDFADSISDKARQVLEEATDKTEVLFDRVLDQAGLTLDTNTVNQENLVEIDGNQYELSEYTIQKGDTLWDLAEDATGDGTNYDLIAEYNGIEDPDVIYAGDTIKIPELVEQDAEQVLAQTPDTTGTVSSSSGQATEATTEPDSEISSPEASIKTFENEFLQVAAEYDLGEPISEIFTHAATESEFQYFDKPGLGTVAIVNSEHGAYPLWGGIRSHYLELGGLNSSLGAPTSPEFNWEGYTRQDFEGGYILWQGTATAYKSDGSLLYPTTNISLDQASSSGMSATVQYDGELVNLSSDDWDYYSSDNTRFDGAIWSGEVDERHLTPESVKQVYDGLSIALFGQRYKMTAGYLYDQSYFNGRGKWHAGIDIDAPDGTAVKAVTGGEVAWVWEGGSSGDFIAIRGDDGREWVYGHLQDKGGFYAGMRVNTGDVVGAVGNQQYASHLHLEVRTGGGSTGGADANQDYVRDVTMSPLQAFWELQPEPQGSYEESFDANIYEDGSDAPGVEPEALGSYEENFDANIYEEGSDKPTNITNNYEEISNTAFKDDHFLQFTDHIYEYKGSKSLTDRIAGWWESATGDPSQDVDDTLFVTSSNLVLEDFLYDWNSDNSVKVTTKIYNPHSLDALIEIYDENGKIVDLANSSIAANKIPESLWEGFKEGFWEYGAEELGRRITDRRNNAEATEIEFSLEEGQWASISVDSGSVILYNAFLVALEMLNLIADAASDGVDIYSDLQGLPASSNSEKLFTLFTETIKKEQDNLLQDSVLSALSGNTLEEFMESKAFVEMMESFASTAVDEDMSQFFDSAADWAAKAANKSWLGVLQKVTFYAAKITNIRERFDDIKAIQAHELPNTELVFKSKG